MASIDRTAYPRLPKQLNDSSDDILGRLVRLILEDRGGVDTLGAHIEAVSAYHGNNYLPLLWRAHTTHRSSSAATAGRPS